MIALIATEGIEFRAPDETTLSVRRLGGPPATLPGLAPQTVRMLAATDDGPVALAEFALGGDELRATTLRLARAGLVRVACFDAHGEELLRGTLTGALAELRWEAAPGPGAVRLTRFAVLRRDGDELVAEAPLAGARVTVLDPRGAAVLTELCRARTAHELRKALPHIDPAAVDDVLRLLLALGLAAPADDDGLLPEDRSPELRQRELPDVLLHAASRSGLTDRPVGGTYPFRDELPPPPALKPVAGPAIALPRPDVAALRAAGPTLAAAMEDRRSVRAFGRVPMTVAQLGEFLFRTARVRAVHPPGDALPYETTDRPYPSGGGAYDLELYVTALRCDGLAPGMYHYDPAGHALRLVSGDAKHVVGMLAAAQRAAGGESAPQVLVTMAARFARTAWKYRGIAYALTLKNVGALSATMQLAATAMGLGGCPIGVGDAALFATATGLDPAAESSVGEFLVGSAE
ncbi:SagB family peptide dehydrogenase [Spirilliplanes yamanashiensis]|uniref:SagB-type dehydrogenase domain-containing protein n=1 Tax=Spirilliplanes yamanashiensis TaxID=42233 RepID=A0A8J4DHI5_9ACTN|nr:SagB family peptide dehydrogenase [Spirilliplanes yamanashiensis]MDP9819996.1 SagB-type dehydrogenase family enzyme [Spirilliplanes yamanashiensis]GIJ01185.1 hypothetical protein Sya03_05370 [Spirilliplanes yamanashiensis]